MSAATRKESAAAPLTLRELAETCFNESIRIDRIICLAGAMSDQDALATVLDDFLGDASTDTLTRLFGAMPQHVLDMIEEDEAPFKEAFCEWMIHANHLGFLANFETPIMTWHGDTASFSWGWYSTQWIYANTWDECVRLGLAWVAERRADEQAEASAKQ